MQSVAILGGGESGVGAALLATKKNIDVFVSDYGEISQKYKNELIDNNIPFEEKGHSIERLENADLIIKSPGIPDTAGILTKLRLRHKEIISEVEFAYRFYEGKVIAITGSNGKTTTTSLVYHILKDSGKQVGLGGNIGHSFARLLSSDKVYDWVVLELSSFQLENINTFSAEIALLLNISPDHLDRYDHSMFKYATAKWQLALNVPSNGRLIVNAEDEWLQLMEIAFPVGCVVERVASHSDIILRSSKDAQLRFDNLKIKGTHNQFNARVAAKACQLAGMDVMKIQKGLDSFEALEHRLEPVAEINGVSYINDSKATNVDAVAVALESMDRPVVWIAGGVDKGNDYTLLNELVKKKVKALICLTTKDEELRAAFEGVVTKIITTQDTKECIRLANDIAEEGDVVLLSPACASFDLFDNYKHRGEVFKEAVRKIALG